MRLARAAHMTKIEKSIDIHVPASVAYSQWTQFEDMPRIVERVENVEQLDDRHVVWEVRAGNVTRRWKAEITEQIPDKRIAWQTEEGDLPNAGCVTFHRLTDRKCRVMVQIEIDPKHFADKAADAFNLLERGVTSALDNLKRFLENDSSAPTGRWEGSVASLDEGGGAHG